MTNIKRIARKEVTDITRDGRFRIVSVIIFILLLISLITGWKYYQETKQQQDAAQAAARRQWEGQDEKNPHSAAHFGTYAFKPQMPLAYFDRGVDAYTGVAVWLEAHKQNPFLFRPAEDSLSVSRFGESTAANLLQTLFPLIIILLTFGALAFERERGTLRQLMSLGISGQDLAFGKMLGIGTTVAILFVPATLIAVLALVLGSGTALLNDSFVRFVLTVVGYLAYFSIFLLIALIVSSWARSSRNALVILLVFWLLNCLILPRIASDVAEGLYPTPSGGAFWAAIDRDMKEGVDGHNPASSRTEEYKQKVLNQYGVSRVEDLPINFAGLSLQEGEEYGNGVFDRRYAELYEIYERQNKVYSAFSVATPLLAIRDFSSGLAGTDLRQHRDFAQAAEQYRRYLNRTLNLHLAYNSRSTDKAYVAGAELWRSLPDFEYTPPMVGTVIRHLAGSSSVLVLWCLGLGVLVYFAIGRLRS